MADSWTLKVDRAVEHLREFDRELGLYLDKSAYGAVRTRTECHDHSHCWQYRLEITEQPDVRLAVILGDVSHNLRSALDHVAVAMAPPGRKRKASFPIISEDIERSSPMKRQADARRRFNDAVQGISADAVAIIREVQPYRQPGSGVHLLEVLSQLDNADKHRELILLSSGLVDASATASARRKVWVANGKPNTLVDDGQLILHFGTDDLWPPVRESEMSVQLSGSQRITVEVGLGPDEALTVDAVHDLVRRIRELLGQLNVYVPGPRAKA